MTHLATQPNRFARESTISRKVGLTILSQPQWIALFRLLKDKQPYLPCYFLILIRNFLKTNLVNCNHKKHRNHRNNWRAFIRTIP